MRTLLPAILLLPLAATAADPAPPSIDKLVEQLGSRSYAERERATRALRERGPAALPALRKAAQGTDEEVRRRAETLIPGLEIEEALLPKRVTLTAADRRLTDVVQDLAKQTGFKLNAVGRADDPTVTADLKDVPFWEALEKAAKDTGKGVDFHPYDRSLHLVPAARRSPFVNVQGPFRLEVTWFHEDRDVDLAAPAGGENRSTGLTLAVSLLAEPRITLLKVHPAKVAEAIDSEGKSLLEPTPPTGGPVAARSGRGSFRGESVTSADVRLRRASETAKTVKLVRGTIPVRAIVIRRPVVVAGKVLEAGGTSFKAGTDSLQILRVNNQGGGSVEVEILVPREESGNAREWHERFHLEDEGGNRFQMNGRGTSSDGRTYRISMYFSPPFNNKKVGPPARLVFEDWVIHDHAVPFEFRDVPLP